MINDKSYHMACNDPGHCVQVQDENFSLTYCGLICTQMWDAAQ